MKRHNAVFEDLYDALAWIRWIRARPSLAALVSESGELLEAFPFLLEDLFRYLYKANPQVCRENELWEDHQFQKKLMDMLISLGLNEFRDQTVLKEPKAVEMAEEIGRWLLEILQGGEGGSGGESEDVSEFLRKLAQQTQNIRPLFAEAEQEQRLLESGELDELMRGMEAGPGWQNIFADKREELRRVLAHTDDLKKFARVLGKIATAFRRRLEQVLSGAEELFDVTQGRDISRTLISELSRLGHQALAVLFWQKFLQGTLLNYKLRSRLPLGKGSKIFLVDLSASLSSGNHFRQALEKLIAAALTLYSRRDGTFMVIYFQGESYDSSRPNLVYTSLTNPLTTEQWVDLATRWGNGGTNFSTPIKAAVELIGEDPRFKSADVVLLSDGKDHTVADKFVLWFNGEKQTRRFSLVTFLIDVDADGIRKDSLVNVEEVARLSDQVVKVSEIFDEDLLREMAEIYVLPVNAKRPSSNHPPPVL